MTPPPPEEAPPVGAGWLSGVLVLAGAGVGIAGWLTTLHLDLLYGGGASALCNFGEGFDCGAVNASSQSELLGIPHALLAIPTYLLLGGLGWATRRGSRAAAETMAGLAGIAVLYSAWLLYVSLAVLQQLCAFCVGLDVINVALLGLAARAVRPRGLVASLGVLTRAPGFVAATVLGGLVLLGGSWGMYTHARAGRTEAAVAAVVAPPAPVTTKATPANAEMKKVRVPERRADVAVPKGAPTRGPAGAKVTIVEFSDFQCPFCERLSGALRQIEEEYPRDVRVVFRHFPMNTDCNRAPIAKSMHPAACSAAAAATCAGEQGKFWEMHDRLFADQAKLGDRLYADAAADLGLDPGKFSACLTAPSTLATIAADSVAGGEHGVNGTPTFFVNGRQLAGGQPVEVLRAVIDAELAGNTALLDLDVALGVEETGPVAGPATVTVDTLGAPFTIDAFEASIEGGKAVSRPGVETARGVSWFEAQAACEAAGKRLCTEREWLSACIGREAIDEDRDGVYSNNPFEGRFYGYPGARRSGACADSRNPETPGAVTTGTHPKCGTPDGIYDLVGNVKEWVGLTPGSAAVKGGSYSSGESARCGYYRDDLAPEQKDAATGFRCCEGPAAIPPVNPGRDVGEQLADFTVPLLDGGKANTASLRGKPAIITFWASWCGPCKKELPALAAMYEKYRATGLQVLAVSVDSDEAKLRSFLASMPLPFPVARDADGSLLATFTQRGVPTSLWVKRDGTIRLRTVGLPPGGERRIEELVSELTGG